MATSDRLFTRPLVYLSFAHLIQGLGFSSMPLLPLYLGYLGASRTDMGLIMATGSFGGLIARPLIGWSLDSWGRRPTLILGTLLMAAALQLVGLVTSVGPLIYGMRFVFGIAVGSLFTGYYAFAADLVPPRRRTEGLALFGISGLVPLAINPAIGQMGFSVSELRWFFPLLGGIILLSLVFVLQLSEPEGEHQREGITLEQVRSGLLERSMWPVWWVAIVFASLVSMYMAFSTVAAESRGIARPALLWLTYGGGAVGVRLFGARLPDRVGATRLVAPSLVLYIAAVLVAAAADSLGGMLLSGLLAGLGHGYCFPVIASQVVGRSPARIRGSALAMFTALWEVAAVSFTPLYGLVSDAFGDELMFSAAAGWAVEGLLTWGEMEQRLGEAGRTLEKI